MITLLYNYFIIIILFNILFNIIIFNNYHLYQQKYNTFSKLPNFLRLFNKICTFITILAITYANNPNDILLTLYY